jgi:transcriptional regulator with GAF, ATPase, and Fis domain
MESATRLQLVDGTTAVVRSAVMQRLMAMVERVARHEAAVLIVGETGVGKELVARAIHEHSLRCHKAFVDVNCAALPEHLVESELFGFEKGAFSGADNPKPGLFEMADGGTIFLDEIGELEIKIQAKLLRVLDGVPYYRLGGRRKVGVNVRVIAATNRDLEEESKTGKFRNDLFHRLTQFQLHVPPLRERGEDIAALAEHFLEKHCPNGRLAPDATEALRQYAWPGNVRELKNVIFKTTLNAKPGKTEFHASDLPSVVCGIAEPAPNKPLGGNLDDMERRMIFQALEQNSGSQTKAAQQLGISSRTLRRKLEKYRALGVELGGGAKSGVLSGQQQRYYRVTLETPVLIKDSEGEEIAAASVNVSSGGIAIKSPVPLKHGAIFEATFSLPGVSSPLESKAKLAWTSPGGLAGLSFVDIHPAFQKQLQQWLLERAHEEGWAGDEPANHRK